MTTPEAAQNYLNQHLAEHDGRKIHVFNPHNKDLEKLPVIYGFNNTKGVLMSEDGSYLGGHICSHESYMWYDLGILEDTRKDRHEDFKKHYSDGYRMEFVASKDLETHTKLKEAFRLNQTKSETKPE